MDLDRVVYKLEADAEQLRSQLAAVKAQVAETGAQFQGLGTKATAGLESTGTAIGGVVRSLGGFAVGLGAALLSVQTLNQAIQAGISEYSNSEASLIRLTSVLKATGNTSGLTVKQLDDLSNSMEKAGIAGDDMVKQAAAKLAQFSTVNNEMFTEVIKLAGDYAAVTGGDIVSATERMGAALEDPATRLTMLRRELKGFSQDAMDSAKAAETVGNHIGAQKIILEEVTRLVGGAGEASTEGMAGAWKTNTLALTDFLGKLVEFTGLGNNVTATLRNMADDFHILSDAMSPKTTGDKLEGLKKQLADLESQRSSATQAAVAPADEQGGLLPEFKQQAAPSGVPGAISARIEATKELIATLETQQQAETHLGIAQNQANQFSVAAAAADKINSDAAGVAAEAAKKLSKEQDEATKRAAEAAVELKKRQDEASTATKQDVADQQRLLNAKNTSIEAYEKVKNAVAAESEARKVGLALDSPAGAALVADALKREALKDKIILVTKAREADQQVQDKQRLLDAQTISTETYEKVKNVIIAENEVRKEGLDINSKEGQALVAEITERETLSDKIDATTKARLSEAAAMKQAQTEFDRKQARLAEDQTRFLEAQGAETERLLNKPFENFRDNLQSSMTSVFEEIYSGGVTSFGDLFEVAKKMAVQFAAEMTVLSIMQPSAMFGAGTAGAGGAAGMGSAGMGTAGMMLPMMGGATFGSAFPGMFGAGTAASTVSSGGIIVGSTQATAGGPASGMAGVGVAPVMMGGMLGAVGGGLVGPALGLNATGSAIGGGVGGATGAAVGSLFPVVGTIAGGIIGSAAGTVLGGLVGNLFGGGKGHHDNNFGGTFDPTTGKLNAGINTSPDPANVQAVGQVATELTSLVQGLKTFGATVDTASITLKSGSESGFYVGGQKFSNLADATGAALKQVLQGVTGLSADQQTVLKTTKATTSQGILADLAVPDQIKQFISSDLINSIKALDTEFNTLKDSAQRLGLSQTELVAAHDSQVQEIKYKASQQIDDFIHPPTELRTAIRAVDTEFDTLKKTADDLGRSQAGLAEAHDDQVRELGKQAYTQINDFIHPPSEFSAALRTLGATFDTLRKTADELNTSQSGLVEAYQNQLTEMGKAAQETASGSVANVASGYNSLIDPLKSFQGSLQTGSVSTGTIATQLEAARSQFAGAVDSANSGGSTSAEINNVIQLGQQMLVLSRSVNASGSKYISDFKQVNDQITQLTGSLTGDRDAFLNTVPKEIRDGATATVNELKVLEDLATKQVSAYKDFMTEQAAAFNDLANALRDRARAASR